MTSYPQTLAVKKLIKMEFFIIKIYYISSSDDADITQTKNRICGLSHFNIIHCHSTLPYLFRLTWKGNGLILKRKSWKKYFVCAEVYFFQRILTAPNMFWISGSRFPKEMLPKACVSFTVINM